MYVYLWWHDLAGMPVGDATALVYCASLLTDQFTATTKALASYSGRKCANPQGLLIAIEHQKDVSIPIPNTRMEIGEEVANPLLGKEIDMYVWQSQQYRQNKAKIYSVALG